MSLDDDTLMEIVEELSDARDAGRQIPPLTERYDLTVDDAYQVQSQLLKQIAGDKKKLGYKIGATNRESQAAIGAEEPSFGNLFKDDLVSDTVIRTDQLIDPRIEPEIGFLLGEELSAGATYLDVLAATRAVVPVIEIADSRIQDWQIRTEDLIADNSLAGQVMVGEMIRNVSGWNAAIEAVRVKVNGKVEAMGTGTQVLDHPASAVAWLSNELDERNESLCAGDLVLSGGMASPIEISANDSISVEFTTVGYLTISVQ